MFRFSPKSRLMAQTKSGLALGRVLTIEVDEQTGRIVNFSISAHRAIPVILDKVLLVDWNQVVEWRSDVLIVADAVVGSQAVVTSVVPNTGSSIQMSKDVNRS